MSAAQKKKDEAQGVFFAEQLTLIEATVAKKEYPAKHGRKLVPADNTGGPGVAARKWRQLDRLGMAKAISEYGDDLPMVSLSGQEFMAKVKDFGIAVTWTQREADEAQFAGVPLNADLAEAARDGYEDTVDELIWLGDIANGVQGLMEHPNIPIHTPGTSAGAGDDTWPNKTAIEMVADVVALLTGVETATKQIHQANLVWMSPERFNLLATTPMPNTSMTVLAYLRGAYPGVVFDKCYRLSTSGAGGTQRMLALHQDKSVFYFWEPQSFTMYPAQQRNFKFIVPCKGAVGGVIVKRPLAIAFMDGI
jgi:hypothetical protein